MSEEIESEVVGEVKTEEPEASEAEVSRPSELEEKALKMGWTPKDEFKGDPAKWRPADEFVERGENMLPIVKAQVKRQANEIAELKDAIRQFGEYHTKTEQRAYQQAMQDLKEQRAQAIATGDGAAFDRVDDQIEKLRDEVKSKEIKPAPHPADDPVFKEWESRNAWSKDPEMQKWAYSYGKHLIEAGEAELGDDVLEKVAKAARSKFPDKFENKRRETAPSVESGVPAQRRGGKGYSDLPAEAKAACDRMAKNAYSGDTKAQSEFKAEYVKNYDWS